MRRIIAILALITAGSLIRIDLAAAAVPGDVTALQGLRGNTLVAGKTTAFRLFLDDPSYAAVSRIDASVLRPDGSRFTRSWSRADAVAIDKSAAIPGSLVVRVPGTSLPWIGSYRFDATAVNAAGAVLARFSIDHFELLETKDIIVGIDRVNAGRVNPGTPAEIQAVRDAVTRLATIWPVRDGISTPDGDRTAGVRLRINNNPQGYGCNGNPTVSDCQLCPFFASMINKPSGTDVMNLGIAFRFLDPGEAVGGIGPTFCPGQSVGFANIESNAPLAAGVGQESGHVFTLEPTNDPHFDPTVQAGHSKDNTIDANDAALGFDIQTNLPFPSPTFDAMHQVVCGCPDNEVAYNTWDWEYLRQHFITLSSTGPSAPASFSSDTAPAVTGVGQSVYFVARRSDGRVFYNRAVLGQAGVGWREMEGNGLTDASPAAAAVGTHVFVAVKGLDGRIWLNQADEARGFGPWFPMEFRTDVAPALAAVADRIFIFAKGLDNRVYVSQAVLGQAFSGWFEVQGGGRTDRSPSAAAVGDHLFVAIRGLDGSLQLNQADLGHAFGGWFPLNFRTDVAPALTSAAKSIFVFAKSIDGRIQLSQAELTHGFGAWFDVQGDGRTSTAPAAGAVGNHLFVAIRALDGRILVNQADFGKAFGAWF